MTADEEEKETRGRTFLGGTMLQWFLGKAVVLLFFFISFDFFVKKAANRKDQAGIFFV